MSLNRIVTLGLALAASVSLVFAEEKATIKSGPQVGEELAGPFHPLNVNGKSAGEKACLYCSNGSNPVAMVFAREATPAVATLVKKLDAACAKNKDAKLGSFVVFCSKDADLEAKLKSMAKETDLKNVVLSIDNPAGPKGYKFNQDADVTVVLYVDRTCKANFTFKKGEMKAKDAEAVIAALPKITEAK